MDVSDIAKTLEVKLVGADIKGYGYYIEPIRTVVYNNKLGTITTRMIILHELGHVARLLHNDDNKKNAIATLIHEREANRFMVRLEIEHYIEEKGIENFKIQDFMREYDFPEDFKPFVKRMLKKVLANRT